MSKPLFDQIVTDHGPMVLRVVRAVVGPHDAEDAWSETFLAALKAYPELPGDANVEAWLVTIAHRKAIDVTRANARRPTPVEEIPERPGRTGRPHDWDPDLWRALKALPDRQRQTVAYHYLAGLPYKEIAALTGGSPEAARRAAADGIKALRGTYPADDGEERAGHSTRRNPKTGERNPETGERNPKTGEPDPETGEENTINTMGGPRR